MCFGGQTGQTLMAVASVAAAPFTGGSSLAMYAAMAGAAVSAYGAYKSAQAQKAQAEYSAKVANANKIQAEINASDALQRGAAAELQQRQKTAQLASAQRAAMAANGVSIEAGTSAVDVLGDTAAQGELDALTIRQNAKRESNNYLAKAGNYDSQAQMSSMTADQTSPWLAAGTSLGNSAITVADKWYKYNQEVTTTPSTKTGGSSTGTPAGQYTNVG